MDHFVSGMKYAAWRKIPALFRLECLIFFCESTSVWRVDGALKTSHCGEPLTRSGRLPNAGCAVLMLTVSGASASTQPGKMASPDSLQVGMPAHYEVFSSSVFRLNCAIQWGSTILELPFDGKRSPELNIIVAKPHWEGSFTYQSRQTWLCSLSGIAQAGLHVIPHDGHRTGALAILGSMSVRSPLGR
jgi:hypothetical protein